MGRFFPFVICLIFTLALKGTASGKTLHAILVADTIHDIRSITIPDINSWQNELKMISQHTGMPLSAKIFRGGDFNKEKIKNYLNSLKADQSDTIIFFFSGHGYRTFEKKTPWPYLTFEYTKPGLDIQWVAHTIRKKNVQFSLIISDCCNNYLEHGLLRSETKNVLIKLKRPLPAYSGYGQLFCNAKGSIVISSCSQGQFSYGSHLGGLYTQCFFASLSRELSEQKPSWKQLLRRANGFISSIQQPVCEIYKNK